VRVRRRLAGSLIEELQRREAAVGAEAEELGGQIAQLTERLAGVEERVSRLVIAREMADEVLSEAAPEASSAVVPDAMVASRSGHLSPVGVLTVPPWRPGVEASALPEACRDLLEVAQDAGRPLRAAQIAAAAGLSTDKAKVEAAAEESPDRAATALRIWPAVVAHIIGLQESGHTPFGGDHDDYALAALIPNPAGEGTYLYPEVENEPIVWWEPLARQSTVERWLPFAQGSPRCVDHLISFLRSLAPEDQARVGLPWVTSLVLADPGQVANRTFLLSSWLIDVRQAASDAGLLSDWQRVVDSLVVAGVSRLAPYSE
jgi:hypothetical protein